MDKNTSINTELHHTFRDRWFHGKDRELLRQGRWRDINLGDIPEHDRDGRIRQAYLAELRGDPETARAIYESIGITRRVSDSDYDGELLDGEVEHYG